MSKQLYTIPDLEWVDIGRGRWRGCVRTKSPYRITVAQDGSARWWRYEDTDAKARQVDCLETAKVLCQLDFETRLSAALSPTPEETSPR